MRKPTAQIIKAKSDSTKPAGMKQSPKNKANAPRSPRAFSPQQAVPDSKTPQIWDEQTPLPLDETGPEQKPKNRVLTLAIWAGGLLISLALALMADQLISDLFARYDWLGWVGVGALTIFTLAIVFLIAGEILALKSLNNLDRLREQASKVLISDIPKEGQLVLSQLHQLYHARADMAKARQDLNNDVTGQFDGSAFIHAAELRLMGQLDAKAKTLTTASARRVAIVTAISPRALVDIAFVAYESLKLARNIAQLYGARPGFFGSIRLGKEILAHLAVTGGVALGDSVVQQLLGHGLAAKLSARLGEGLINGLMSVRVGIAAMGVTRPLPYDRLKKPQVMDFMADLANITKEK